MGLTSLLWFYSVEPYISIYHEINNIQTNKKKNSKFDTELSEDFVPLTTQVEKKVDCWGDYQEACIAPLSLLSLSPYMSAHTNQFILYNPIWMN